MTMVANWAWFRPQYLPFAAVLDQPYWIWVRYLLPTVLSARPGAGGARACAARRWPCGPCRLVFVFLAKGLNAAVRAA